MTNINSPEDLRITASRKMLVERVTIIRSLILNTLRKFALAIVSGHEDKLSLCKRLFKATLRGCTIWGVVPVSFIARIYH